MVLYIPLVLVYTTVSKSEIRTQTTRKLYKERWTSLRHTGFVKGRLDMHNTPPRLRPWPHGLNDFGPVSLAGTGRTGHVIPLRSADGHGWRRDTDKRGKWKTISMWNKENHHDDFNPSYSGFLSRKKKKFDRHV